MKLKDPQLIWTLLVTALVSLAAIYHVASGPSQFSSHRNPAFDGSRSPQSEVQELLRPSNLQ